jgi:MFS family permease
MIAISLLVRYADFVTYLGGGEGQLGLIVGVGMLGSLAMRLVQGSGIDRYGPRAIWLGSLVLLVISLLAHLAVETAAGIAIFLARVVMQTSIAGIFGASITCVSRRVPPPRMAEIIGTLGTSGFIGILLGPQLGDWILGSGPTERGQLEAMFLCAAGLVCLALVTAWGATWSEPFPPRRRRPPLTALMGRYHPGPTMLVAAAVGAGLALPNTFLRPFAAERSIARIGVFFATYAVAAFAARVATRRHFQRRGNRMWVLVGLSALSLSIALYLIVWQTWQLVIPGIVGGLAHALLFPSVVASGSTSFPERYRGLGTTLMLAMFDIGSLLGAPMIGGLLLGARWLGWPAYPVTFVLSALSIAAVAVYFAASAGRADRRAKAAGLPRGSGARGAKVPSPRREPLAGRPGSRDPLRRS